MDLDADQVKELKDDIGQYTTLDQTFHRAVSGVRLGFNVENPSETSSIAPDYQNPRDGVFITCRVKEVSSEDLDPFGGVIVYEANLQIVEESKWMGMSSTTTALIQVLINENTARFWREQKSDSLSQVSGEKALQLQTGRIADFLQNTIEIDDWDFAPIQR